MKQDVLTAFLTQIGKNITAKRKQKNLSLEKFGVEIGLTRMQVYRIEEGLNITAATLLKVSFALGVMPEELVRFDHVAKKEDLEFLVNNKISKPKKEGAIPAAKKKRNKKKT